MILFFCIFNYYNTYLLILVLLKKCDIIFIVRDLFKKIIIGIALIFSSQVYAEDYKVLVIPDNIVTENASIDSFIYNASAEFFADEVINLLNGTDHISSPAISDVRNDLKNNPSTMLATKSLTNKFRTTYNIDYTTLRKIAQNENSRYVLLMTSYIDAENYILRRTPWDVLNIPGASVIDPAYKISTYAVLVDTERNYKMWADTFYKTISVCENRIITRGPSPQTEQLQKIKDYSRYIAPQIAQNVQQKVLPPEVLAKENTKIDYGIGDIDNVFTKKYRHIGKEADKLYNEKKAEAVELKDKTIEKGKEYKNKLDEYLKNRAIKKQEQLNSKLEVKATPVYNEDNLNNINNKTKESANSLKKAIFKKKYTEPDYCELIKIEIEKKKKNNLVGEFDLDQPELRDYCKVN